MVRHTQLCLFCRSIIPCLKSESPASRLFSGVLMKRTTMPVPPESKGMSLTELDDLMQCPVCYEVPTGHIYQCNEGHHVCVDCKTRLDNCPVCRSLFFGTRNYALEELIAGLRKVKVNQTQAALTAGPSAPGSSESESTESASSADAVTNTSSTQEASTPATRTREPMASRGLFRCLCCMNLKKERLPMARMLNHLRYYHSLNLIEGQAQGEEYVQAWQFPTEPGTIVIAIRIANMGIFFLVIEIRPEKLNAWVSMVAAPWDALNFKYSLTISGSDREAVFSDCVWSVRSCEGQLKKRERCLMVCNGDLEALFSDGIVTGRLCIKRSNTEEALQAHPRAVVRVANRSSSDAGSTNSIGSAHRRDLDIMALMGESVRRTSLGPIVPQQPTSRPAAQPARAPAAQSARGPSPPPTRGAAPPTARGPVPPPTRGAAQRPISDATAQSARASTAQSVRGSSAQPARDTVQPARSVVQISAPQSVRGPAPRPARDAPPSLAPPARPSESQPMSRNARRRQRNRLSHAVEAEMAEVAALNGEHHVQLRGPVPDHSNRGPVPSSLYETLVRSQANNDADADRPPVAPREASSGTRFTRRSNKRGRR